MKQKQGQCKDNIFMSWKLICWDILYGAFGGTSYMQKKIKKNGGGGTLNDTMGGRDLHGGKRFLEGGSSNFGGHHGHAESGPK